MAESSTYIKQIWAFRRMAVPLTNQHFIFNIYPGYSFNWVIILHYVFISENRQAYFKNNDSKYKSTKLKPNPDNKFCRF